MKENLLRDLYERHEIEIRNQPTQQDAVGLINVGDLVHQRSWSTRGLRRTIGRLRASKHIFVGTGRRIGFTELGVAAAKEVVRKHRLWEAYLISHADVATGMVDLSADRIEHVLDEEIIRKLEALFFFISPKDPPQSPHTLLPDQGAA